MKISYANFKQLAEYMEKKATGSDMTFTLSPNSIEIKVTNLSQDQAVITVFPESDTGASFPKIAVTRRLGDEIK